jgi:hypothetical protein
MSKVNHEYGMIGTVFDFGQTYGAPRGKHQKISLHHLVISPNRNCLNASGIGSDHVPGKSY